MTLSPESNDLPPHEISTLDEVIADFDTADLELRMAYSNYLDKPNKQKMSVITSTTGELFDNLGSLMQKVIRDRTDQIEQNEKVMIIATMLHDLGTAHSQLLAEYSSTITLPTLEESRQAYEHICECIEEKADEDDSKFVEEVLGHFRSILDSDMEVIEHILFEQLNSPRQLFIDRAKKVGVEMGKIAGAVVIGVTVASKLQKR